LIDRGARMKRQAPSGDESKSIGQAFADIALLAAADVIKAAISGGRRHVDQIRTR